MRRFLVGIAPFVAVTVTYFVVVWLFDYRGNDTGYSTRNDRPVVTTWRTVEPVVGWSALPTLVEVRWVADVLAYDAWLAEQERLWLEAEARRAEEAEQARAAQPATTRSSGRCGGDLPPCYVMMRESRGNIRAQNPTSTASGKWQFLDSTWANHRGYAKARHAPEWVQDEKARELWAGGAGCSHWAAC